MWTEEGIAVFNLGTQATWRTKAELHALETAAIEMVRLAERAEITRIGLPRIGSGLGGLPWAEVRELLARIGDETDVELIVFEKYEPARSSQKSE